MKFANAAATLYVPDGVPPEEAYRRTTHMGIGAHQDDLEIMAFHGIRACYGDPVNWFGGVTCTDGRGSARDGEFASLSDDQMAAVRREEQNRAADIGKYSYMAQLNFPSTAIKGGVSGQLEDELFNLLRISLPGTVYAHNPADKHETHIAVLIPALHALRRLDPDQRPQRVYGCEVWRGLDWMMDQDKVALDADDLNGLGKKLVDVFQSQVNGGKRYDLATFGRRMANATYYQSHRTDDAGQLVFAMDLTPLVHDLSLDIVEFVNCHIRRFQQDVEQNLKKYAT